MAVPMVRVLQHLRSNARYFSLLKNKAYVNGKWCDASSGASFDVTNPATGETVGSVPDMTADDVEKAIRGAHDAFQTWQLTTAKARGLLLRKWYDLLVKNQDDLAKLMTAEAGKTLAESVGEVVYGSSFVEWFSEEARRIYGDVVQSPVQTKEMIFVRQPIGVAALITPWNFPNAMITRKAAAALACGCTCVIKPAEDTPLSALALAELAEQAGFPPGTINVITCSRKNTPPVGKLFCESPLVAGVSFTGSTQVGKILYKQCSSGIKRIGLELGGNAPFIVFNSADIPKAVQGAIASKFRNCGQTCVSANRFLVEEGVYDEFLKQLEAAMKTMLVVGDGTAPNVTLGPLINADQLWKVDELVKDAVKKGANVVVGGKPHPLGLTFYEPTLLTNVTSEMKCYHEEIFGPVASCIKFSGESEALKIANSSRSGLAGYFYTENISQAWRVAKRLEVGMVGINEGIISSAEAAFGGVKESGIGREGSHYGIDDYTHIKYLCFGNL